MLDCLKNTRRRRWPSDNMRDRFKQAISIRRGVLNAKVQKTNFKHELRRHNRLALAEKVHECFLIHFRFGGGIRVFGGPDPAFRSYATFARYRAGQDRAGMTERENVLFTSGLRPGRRIRVIHEVHLRELLINNPTGSPSTVKQLFEDQVVPVSDAFTESVVKQWFEMETKVATRASLPARLTYKELSNRVRVYEEADLDSGRDSDDDRFH